MTSRRGSLRQRVVLAGVGTMAVIGAGLACFGYLCLRAHLSVERDWWIRQELTELVKDYHRIAGDGPRLDRDAVQRLIDAEAGELAIVVRDAAGAVLAHSPALRLDESVSAPTRYYVVSMDVRGRGLPFGFVEGLVPKGQTRRIKSEFRRSMWLGVPVAVGLGGALLWLLIGRALAPLAAIARAAEAIDPEDLSRRLPPTVTGDELARLTSVFNSLIDRLEAAFRASRSFAADVSHELRTPLTVLRGALETAQTHGDPAVRQSALEGAAEELGRMTRLIDELLTLTRLGAPSGVEFEPVAADELVAAVIEDAAALAEEQSVRIQSAPLPSAVVRGNRALLRQALWNLIENSLHVTGAGQTIAVTAERREGRLCIAVRDHGPGIDPSLHRRVFEPFFRLPAPEGGRRHEGLGLGLALAERIVERHGGRIELESRPGAGACFTIDLPLSEG